MQRIVFHLRHIKRPNEYVQVNRYATLVQKHAFDKHLAESKQFGMFRADTGNLYKFDDETRRLVEWTKNDLNTGTDWQASPAALIDTKHLLTAFDQMVKYSIDQQISLTHTCFDQFIDQFIARMPQFGINDLICSLQIFARTKLTRELIAQRNFIELHRAFDRHSTIELPKLQMNQVLFLCSVWLEIPFHGKTWFAVCASRWINRRFKTMNTSELALAAYNLTRLARPIDEVRELEQFFNKNLSSMTPEEIAMVTWAFERNATKLENLELRSRFFQRLAQCDSSGLSEVVLGRILPVCKFHFKLIIMKLVKNDTKIGLLSNFSIFSTFSTFSIFSIFSIFFICSPHFPIVCIEKCAGIGCTTN